MSCCKLCLFEWDDENRIPRVLLCGHTFCQCCIKISVQQNLVFFCIQCQVQYGQQDLREAPINRTLIEYIEEVRQKQQFYSEQKNQFVNETNSKENNINTSRSTNSDRITNQVIFESIKQKRNDMEDQEDQIQPQIKQYAKADDICMIEDCNNIRVYKYGKKQVFCEKCLNKNCASLFYQNNQADAIVDYNMNASPFVYYSQNVTPSTSVYSTPLKDKIQPHFSNLTSVNSVNPLSSIQQPQNLSNSSILFSNHSKGKNFTSPPPPQPMPYQRNLFQTPQYNNNNCSSQNQYFPQMRASQFNTPHELNYNLLKTQVQY